MWLQKLKRIVQESLNYQRLHFFLLVSLQCMQGVYDDIPYLHRLFKTFPNQNALRVDCASLLGELPELPGLQHMAWEHLLHKCVQEEHPGSKNYHRILLCCILTTFWSRCYWMPSLYTQWWKFDEVIRNWTKVSKESESNPNIYFKLISCL